jgi:DNA-binding transcriptional LysR family regulator
MILRDEAKLLLAKIEEKL